MQHVTDAMVEACVSPAAAQAVVEQAFLDFGREAAAMQQRERIDAGGVKLSTLGAVIPSQGVAGAKVYTTIKGVFSFVILLFSARDGRPLATFDAAAVTRKRTAASSVLMARRLARPDARCLGVFGLGTQGAEHAVQLSAAFPIERILVSDPYAGIDTLARLAQATGRPVEAAEARDIAAHADILVTASRSETPLFRGEDLAPGAFVAAIGSSLPHTRELDDAALARADAIVVEWRRQALAEAGDLVLAAPGLDVAGRVVEFADVLEGRVPVPAAGRAGVAIYKAVGVGLQDIAVAGHAYCMLAEAHGWPRP